jgi:acetyl-CoA carboxylase biotin carboxylase subunit
VKEQFRVSGGQPLSIAQEEIKLTGHAVECRINAESPQRGFQPSPGRIVQWKIPEETGIRIDSHCYAGYFVPPYYDSLLAKIIAIGDDRLQAIEKMQNALHHFWVSGVDTNIEFHRFLLGKPDYRQGHVNTRWVENLLAEEYGHHEND